MQKTSRPASIFHLKNLWLVLIILSSAACIRMQMAPDTTLSDNLRITSEQLGYDLQYRVYTPPGYESLEDLPVVYVTDGQWYIESGDMPNLMENLILSGKMEPAIAVFVDNRNPDNLEENRRNRQFFCNQRYADFYAKELIPHIDKTYKTNSDRAARVILGLSFGGLNSACFGLIAHETFEGIAIQSPATHPIPSLHQQYQESPRLPLKIFLSSGTYSDNEDKTRRFKRVLELKGYDFEYIEVPHAHTWENWKPLLDDVLTYYFRK